MGRPRNPPAPPTSELGINGLSSAGNWGFSGMPPWRMFVDEMEYVPELVYPQSINTFGVMRTDTQLAALFYGTTLPIRRYRWMIDPNGASEETVVGVSEDLNLPIKGQDEKPRGRMKRRFVHDKHLNDALLALIYGHYGFEQVGEIVNGKWRLRKLAVRHPRTISTINVADDGGLVSIEQYGTRPGGSMMALQQPMVPVDRLVWYPWDMEGMNWIGRSMFRDCFKNFIIKDRLLRIDAINHERAGGIIVPIAPPGATWDETQELAAMSSAFRIGDSSGGALPPGSDLQFVRGTGSGVVESIKYHDQSMARRFLMMFIELGQSESGSRALGQEFIDYVALGQESVANWYCDITNEHVIEDWVDWNEGEDAEYAPRLVYEKREDDAFGVTELVQLIDSGALVVDGELEDWLRGRYNLPDKQAGAPDPQEMVDKLNPPPVAPSEMSGEQKPLGAGGGQTVAASEGAPSSSRGRLSRFVARRGH